MGGKSALTHPSVPYPEGKVRDAVRACHQDQVYLCVYVCVCARACMHVLWNGGAQLVPKGAQE